MPDQPDGGVGGAGQAREGLEHHRGQGVRAEHDDVADVLGAQPDRQQRRPVADPTLAGQRCG